MDAGHWTPSTVSLARTAAEGYIGTSSGEVTVAASDGEIVATTAPTTTNGVHWTFSTYMKGVDAVTAQLGLRFLTDSTPIEMWGDEIEPSTDGWARYSFTAEAPTSAD